jgi:hypothetical protein
MPEAALAARGLSALLVQARSRSAFARVGASVRVDTEVDER